MNGWLAALLTVPLALNPVALARQLGWDTRTDPRWRSVIVPAALAALAVLAVLALLTEPILNLLSVTTPTFRLAAATVLGLSGAAWMLGRGSVLDAEPDDRDARTITALHILSPAPVFTAMAAVGDGGIAAGLVALAIGAGLVLAAVASLRVSAIAGSAAVRFVGAAALVTAVFIGLDAARTV